MAEEATPNQFQVEARWPTRLGAAPEYANQLAVGLAPGGQHGEPDGGLFLMFGRSMPPMLTSPQIVAEFFAENPNPTIEIELAGLYYVPFTKAVEFHRALGEQLALIEPVLKGHFGDA